jgi:uncharacterized protein
VKLSRTAVIAPIPGRSELLLVQPLSGQAALLEPGNAAALQRLASGGHLPADLPEATLREAGFVVDGEEDDRRLLAEAWAAWSDEAEKTPTQLIVVPTFGCNLRCTYCYQEVFDPSARGLIAPEVIDAFFRFVDERFGDEPQRPYLTLFGGEPLVDTPAHHDRLRRFLDGARARDMKVAAVTNGYDLGAFAAELAAGGAKEIQVTLDGPQAIHDARRPHGSGTGSFGRAVRGVEALVAAGVPVNLRVVVDRDNLDHLPALARIAQEEGWLDLPEARFKTQIGRNYELFGCASQQRRDALFDRVTLWTRFAELAKLHPELRRFHLPRFHGIRHLAEKGELPVPNFDACPAAKKEWAFSPDGGLYGCTATVGNPKYRLGSFWPRLELDPAAIAPWRARNVTTIEKCRSCEVATVCGGGCGALADAQGQGIGGPDCRPVKELYGIGAAFYGLGQAE